MRAIRNIENKIKINATLIEQKIFSIKDQDSYILYLIIENYLHSNKGYFNLDQLVSIFRDNIGYKSLKQKSNIYKFKGDLYKKLLESTIFFKHIKGEIFKIISNRKILNDLGTSKYKSTYFYFSKDLLKRKNKIKFRDAIIGSLLLKNKGYSNNQVAKHFNITVMRVQKATQRNNKSKIIKKHFRFGMSLCNNKKDAFDKQHKLWLLGIRTIVKEKGKKWYVCCFRTNSYDITNTVQSHKVRVRSSAEDKDFDVHRRYSQIVKQSVVFKKLGLKSKKCKISLPNEGNLFYNFNEEPKKGNPEWNLDLYVQEYGYLYA